MDWDILWAAEGQSRRAVGETVYDRAQSCPNFGTGERTWGVYPSNTSIFRAIPRDPNFRLPTLTKRARERPPVESWRYLQEAVPSTPEQ